MTSTRRFPAPRCRPAAGVLLLLALAACRTTPPPEPVAPAGPRVVAKRPPNIVLMIADDHGWTDYGFMGHPVVETPTLDRLAARGLLYTRGYMPSSLCRPNLATLLTGLYPQQHGIVSNDPPRARELDHLAALQDPEWIAQRAEMIRHIDAVPTLPRLLAERGYRSFQTGKWWEGGYARGGFTHGMTTGDPERRARHGDDGLRIGRRTMDPIVHFLDEVGDEPFFLWYAPLLPHLPHDPPADLLQKYAGTSDSEHVARYWATVEWFDQTCGRLVYDLERRGLMDDTVIVFLADNGWTQSPTRASARRSKGTSYDAGLRTPILIHWPDRIRPGSVDQPVSGLDIAPTLLKAAGLAVPPQMPGIDLLDPAAVSARTHLFGAVFSHTAVSVHDPAANLRYRWVVHGRWKLIVDHRTRDPELYDLSVDPAETSDLAAANRRAARRLRRALDRWWRPG